MDALQRCEKEGPYSENICCTNRRLTISKDRLGFTRLELYYVTTTKRKTRISSQLIWDIHVRNSELMEFNKMLTEMKNTMDEVRNVTRSNQ